MKRTMIIALGMFVLATAIGCQSGRRGARCGIPTFRMPRFSNAAQPQPACNKPACNAPNQGPPMGYAPMQPAYPMTEEFPTSPMTGPLSTQTNYTPIYAEKPMSPGEIVIGPESSIIPTGP